MGPLVPDIISNEFNLIIAFVVGIFFGMALEQAGFSSTRKLVGLFYGYDFTVLKVFFTAGVTAMTGVLLLSHFGMLDMRLIYINPTYLRSALVGGVIMGGGFVIGGFCPGTSVCAAAVGKLDAWSFIGGSIIGIFIFTEAFPLFQDFYMADYMGSVTMFDMLGMSRELFAIILALVAVMAFYFTGLLEDKINGIRTRYPAQKMMKYAIMAVIPFLMVSFISVTPNQKEYYFNRVEKAFADPNYDYDIYEIDHLADELASKSHKMNIIDLRSPEKFEQSKLPTAVNIPLDSMLKKEYQGFLRQTYKFNVFYADDLETAKKGYLMANMIGNSQNFVLINTVDQFIQWFYEPEIPGPDAPKEARDKFLFRLRIGEELKELEERLKNLQAPVKKEIKRVQGGCA